MFWVTVLRVRVSMLPVAITAPAPVVATFPWKSVSVALTMDPLTPPTTPRLLVTLT